MAQKERVEVQSVSLNTALIIGVVCLVVGFLGGNVYSTYKSGPAAGAPNMGIPSAAPAGSQFTPQQSGMILDLEKLVAADANNADAWLQLGNLYFDSNNFQKSINAYRNYVGLVPDNPNAWTDMGVMYRRTGQFNEAIGAFDRAIELDPRHQQSRYNKGVVLLHDLSNLEGALQVWRELAKINPDFRTPDGRLIKDILIDQ